MPGGCQHSCEVCVTLFHNHKVLIRLSMYNTRLPNVWSPALNPHANPIITHFNYRIIPVGYCIIIVANIINIQLIGTCITCFAF